jgi:hypothetical protein
MAMKWKLESKNLIVHVDGHSIELKAGSWRAPMDIHPKIVRGTPAVEVAQLIREGLSFAYKATQPGATSIDGLRSKQSAS